MKQRAPWIRSIALVALAFCLGFLLGKHGSVEDTQREWLSGESNDQTSSTETKDAGTSPVVKPIPDATPPDLGQFFTPKFVSGVTD